MQKIICCPPLFDASSNRALRVILQVPSRGWDAKSWRTLAATTGRKIDSLPLSFSFPLVLWFHTHTTEPIYTLRELHSLDDLASRFSIHAVDTSSVLPVNYTRHGYCSESSNQLSPHSLIPLPEFRSKSTCSVLYLSQYLFPFLFPCNYSGPINLTFEQCYRRKHCCSYFAFGFGWCRLSGGPNRDASAFPLLSTPLCSTGCRFLPI